MPCRCEPGAAPLQVAVLLSGGVDSSLALHLLKAAGHHVTAFYLQVGCGCRGLLLCQQMLRPGAGRLECFDMQVACLRLLCVCCQCQPLATPTLATLRFLQIWFQEDFRNFWDACPWEEDLAYCQAVCERLGVSH